jgi:DNA replication and repair protein RecF
MLETGGEPRHEISLGWSAAAGRARSLDGKSGRLSEQIAAFPLLVWTEAESALVGGPPAVRRRFFDRGLVLARPALLARLGRYERALAEKRTLLARGGGARELAAWNELLAAEGAAIAAARAAFVAAIGAELGSAVAASGLALPPIELAYRPSPAAALDGEAAYGAAIAAAAAAELARRQPLAGAQRDEIEIRWDGAAARRSASAGERKAVGLLLLASLASHLATRGVTPTLLLDDADTELDRARLARLLAAFAPFPRLLVSSNRPEVWPASAGLATVDVEALANAASEA